MNFEEESGKQIQPAKLSQASLSPNNPEGEVASTSNNKQITRNYEEDDGSWKWVDNKNKEIEKVFGFSSNAELINGRLAMISFILLLLSELAYRGEPVTRKIFGIG